MTSEVFTLLEQIDDAYALYRSEKTTLPKYLILGPEYRQAIKVEARLPDHELSPADVKTYMGIPVIPYEDVVILRTRTPHLTFKELMEKYYQTQHTTPPNTIRYVDDPHDGPEIESIDRVIAPSGWLHRLLWGIWHRYVLRDFVDMEARRGELWSIQSYSEFLKDYEKIDVDLKEKRDIILDIFKRQGIKIHVEHPTTYLDEIDPE